MPKNQAIRSPSKIARLAEVRLGAAKASKFAKVEGMTLSVRSAKTYANAKSRGLEGDRLRSEISRFFKK